MMRMTPPDDRQTRLSRQLVVVPADGRELQTVCCLLRRVSDFG